MSHDQETTIADVLRGRMATYQFLSRLFRVEVDQELYDTLMSMRFPANTGNALVDEGYRMICGYLSQADGTVLTELAVDYVRAFIGSGNDGFSAAYPYESVYTSPKRLMMQDARDEVLVLYRAFGLDKQESWKEGEDHIALELEFEQILCERAIRAYEAGDEDECLKLLLSQRNFLEDHLLAWYPMMAADLQKFPQTDFYKGLGKLTDGFLRNDREFLDAVLSEKPKDPVRRRPKPKSRLHDGRARHRAQARYGPLRVAPHVRPGSRGSVRRHRAGRREVPAQCHVAAPAGRAGRGAAGARLPALREVPRGVPEACHRSCSS